MVFFFFLFFQDIITFSHAKMFIFGVSVIDNALHELGQVTWVKGKGLRKSVKTVPFLSRVSFLSLKGSVFVKNTAI